MYSGIPSNVDVSFASDVEITLKREVSPIVEEKYVIPLILYIVSSGSSQRLVVDSEVVGCYVYLGFSLEAKRAVRGACVSGA